MATIKIEIKPIKSKKEELQLHIQIDRFIAELNLRFGKIVLEYFKPTFREK